MVLQSGKLVQAKSVIGLGALEMSKYLKTNVIFRSAGQKATGLVNGEKLVTITVKMVTLMSNGKMKNLF